MAELADATARTRRGLDAMMKGLSPGAPGGVVGLVLLLVALVAVFSLAVPGRFLTVQTAQSMMYQLPELGLLALAMAFPLISGGLNLAIIATTNQCALLMALIMTRMIGPSSSAGEVALAILLATLAGLALSATIGFVSGALIAYTGTHPILVTLGVMSVVDGFSVYFTHGTVISGFPAAFQWIGNGTLLAVPVPFLILVAVAVGVGLVLSRTAFGTAVYMIGSNVEAARYSGVDTRRTLIGIYTLSGVLCFAAACLMMARFNSASAGYAQSYLLVTILAAVLGGIDPQGGFGRILGLMIALAVLQVIASGFNLLGASQHLTLAIWGVTLVAVMGTRFFILPLIARWRGRGR
jgi:simple sugar transport system permease protein